MTDKSRQGNPAHEFLRFQVADHQTGDTTEITKAPWSDIGVVCQSPIVRRNIKALTPDRRTNRGLRITSGLPTNRELPPIENRE
jgi:hypothetical protein